MGWFEKEKGSDEWWIRYADQYGHIRREKVGSKSLAKKVYQKRKTEIRENRFFPERLGHRKDMLFADMSKLYLEDHSKVNKRSYVTDCYVMTRLNETFGSKALSEITTQDVERFKGHLAQSVAPATVNRHLALLSGIFNKAAAWGKTKLNPIKDIKPFKENNERVRYLTEEEELILRPQIPDQHWLKVEVAINTGLRRGEQFGLKWPEINFPTRTITIRRSKSGEMRHVRMNDRVMEIFRGLPSRLKSGWVFPSETGQTPLDANNFINRVFNPALERANISDFRWHDLRHTFPFNYGRCRPANASGADGAQDHKDDCSIQPSFSDSYPRSSQQTVRIEPASSTRTSTDEVNQSRRRG